MFFYHKDKQFQERLHATPAVLDLDWASLEATLVVVTSDGVVPSHLLLLAVHSPMLRDLLATVAGQEGLPHLHLPGFRRADHDHLVRLLTKGEVQVQMRCTITHGCISAGE